MRVKDREINKVGSRNIKRYEPILDNIDKYEESLISDFLHSIGKIFGKYLLPILDEIINAPNIKSVETVSITVDGKDYVIPRNLLQDFHKSYIKNPQLREVYETRLKMWFSDKTKQLKAQLEDVDSYEQLMKISAPAFALASLALTAFHKRPNMKLRDVQKMTGLAVSEGDIAELSSGEGKTLSAVLPVYLQALRGKGVHVITSNGYLSKRDYEETLPIYEGLGLTSGYIPDNAEELSELEGKKFEKLPISERIQVQKRLREMKRESYRKDISYGSKETFAFDYLRDCLVRKQEDLLQREEKPGFALIDEVDDALIDDARVPYIVSVQTPMYVPNMSLRELCMIQGIPYQATLGRVGMYLKDHESLTYEEARFVSNMYGTFDLLADPSKYQEAAERFFQIQKVFVTEDNQLGFKTGKDLFRALQSDDNEELDEIRNGYGIIYCPELQDYKISDKCLEDFLKYCYFSFKINAQTILHQEQIIKDNNYVEGIDYKLTIDGRVRLTMNGANKILVDSNYPEFIDDYNKYMASVSKDSAIVLHYLQQAVKAHLIMKKDEDYIIESGRIKTIKNGRIIEGSTYSNGLHQAIEIKEGIPRENRTKETTTSSSITQKEYYSRYDLFSGMTGTSSKSVFGSIFGKGTVEIPKHAFYSYYGKRKVKGAKEPLGVDVKETKFTMTREEKVKLIVKSIEESKRMNPQQPVLIVVSDYDEIALIEKQLKEKGIVFNTLTANTSKEDEALIISEAGVPGAVTISTEMAGRGTDIKIGGDRETIIDIATERHIRMLEQSNNIILNLPPQERLLIREKVEKALETQGLIWSKEEEEKRRESLDSIGLKVVSSGFFETKRIDRQLEGRTGRNGISGVCERYACPDDLKRIGLATLNSKDSIEVFFARFNKYLDGSLEIDEATYQDIMTRIDSIQKINEDKVKDQIKDSQQLNSYATKVIEECREQRRKIICGQVDTEQAIKTMIEEATNAIISSFIIDKEISEEDLTKPLNENGLQLDIYALNLEIKQILGISFEPESVLKSNINLLELRDAIVRTALERRREANEGKDPEKIKEKDIQTLLLQNDYMIANVPDILESSFSTKRLVAMSMGMEGQQEAFANIKFGDMRKRILYESYKHGLRSTMGLPLTGTEFKELEKRKSRLFSMSVAQGQSKEEYEVKEARYQENNPSVVERLKTIKEQLARRDKEEMEHISKKIAKAEKKGEKVDISELYSSLSVRPMKLIQTLVEGKRVTTPAIVREDIRDRESVKKHSLK